MLAYQVLKLSHCYGYWLLHLDPVIKVKKKTFATGIKKKISLCNVGYGFGVTYKRETKQNKIRLNK